MNFFQGYSLGELIFSMTGRDPRFDAFNSGVTSSLDLHFVEKEIRFLIERQLARGEVEVTVAGDVDSAHVAKLAGKYLGTIVPKQINEAELQWAGRPTEPSQISLYSPYYNLQVAAAHGGVQKSSLPPNTGDSLSSGNWAKAWGRRLHVFVRDSETRAVVHIGGFACNRWGRNPDGSWIWEHMDAVERKNDSTPSSMEETTPEVHQQRVDLAASEHRKHPAFPRVALWILQELVTKRLFSILREEQRLTYEAAFDVMSFDILRGGIFIITVHTQPEEAERVLEATHVALQQLKTVRPLLQSQLEGAKQQVLMRHEHDRKYARYWLDLLGGLQLSDVSKHTDECLRSSKAAAQKVSAKDRALVHLQHGNATRHNMLHVGRFRYFCACRFLERPVHTLQILSVLSTA